ncbi:MAG: AAA family ATPase [Cyclobacteriaceae bacterium]|nr:AAA family ATPase [Cyclobacteriaceae bacterium]
MHAISDILIRGFEYVPTDGQRRLFALFDTFLKEDGNSRKTILLKGYAGTGKTSAVQSITNALPAVGYQTQLLAPTGRAAKVLSHYTGKLSSTIHRKIYRRFVNSSTGGMFFKRIPNTSQRTLYIIDEASMLSDEAEFSQNSLIEDLIAYVFSHPSNRLMLIGDDAQLPPVGKINSPALDAEALRFRYGLDVQMTELTEVLRQEQGSGILYNATLLRSMMRQEEFDLRFTTRGFRDIYKMYSDKLEDGLRYAYNKYGNENAVIICRSNWQAVRYNELIRRQIFFYEEELEAGDVLMVARNNYLWLQEHSQAGFIANGDFLEVRKIIDTEERHGLRFACLRLQFTDYPDDEPFDAWVILDTLHSKTTSLPDEEQKKLYEKTQMQYEHIESKTERREAMQTDPYLNALQVKFAYALTCHKSQGGQWPVAFVDQGLMPDKKPDNEYLRWLYTGITRASRELYLMNFNPEFFT